MKTAICYLSCDKPELMAQSLPPLVAGAVKNQYHLFIADGSRTEPGEKALYDLAYPTATIHSNVRGGAGAAIVYALTWMLDHVENYDVVGLCEQDVLLPPDWFGDCSALFQRGDADGLVVGAVSSRCYEDRVLFQRDGYAVCHNLGAGHVLFTREAARLVLDNFRTAYSSDNRRVFSQIAGRDIGPEWAFKFNEHPLTADWHWEVVLAAHGYAALALTPSPVEMIGQNPPLAEQGLTLVKEPVLATDPATAKTLDAAFKHYRTGAEMIRHGILKCEVPLRFQFDPMGTWNYFPHQMHMIGGQYEGDWHLKEMRGWGTFAWKAGDGMEGTLVVPIFGPCAIMIGGGESGGTVRVEDEHSGFKMEPQLPPEGEGGHVLQLQIPGGMIHRKITITALSPGICFYGIQTREAQPSIPNAKFDYSNLPPV